MEDGIARAGSAVELLRKPDAEPWLPEGVDAEYAEWRREQAAWRSGVAFLDLSHHMSHSFIEGPAAVRLLDSVSADDCTRFEIGQAKQLPPLSARAAPPDVPIRQAGHAKSAAVRQRPEGARGTGRPAMTVPQPIDGTPRPRGGAAHRHSQRSAQQRAPETSVDAMPAAGALSVRSPATRAPAPSPR
ncbi:hypothetical protein ABZ642_16050 [Streptomyces sp. NPDC007157]|uniref:hypothetical protein n=1 Tax=Streptomyces sp. NPDC007157 TaxID=3154681 RepID=UPI0033CCCCB0